MNIARSRGYRVKGAPKRWDELMSFDQLVQKVEDWWTKHLPRKHSTDRQEPETVDARHQQLQRA